MSSDFSSDFLKSERLATIVRDLRATSHATADILSSITATTCRRFPKQSANFAQLDRLIAAGAFTEAVLALIELELPQWKLRRIAYDEGEWHCALSRQREIPDWLDQSIEANHADLPLAIALTYLEAARIEEPSWRSNGHTVPEIQSQRFETMSCENYA